MAEQIIETWECEAGHKVRVIQCPHDPAPFEQKVKDYNRFHNEDFPECRSNVHPREAA